MGQGDREAVTSTIQDRFRTPNKPASASKLKRAPARLGSFANTSGPTSTSTRSTDSTLSFSNSSTDQTTLTQIDFVTVSQQDESDEDFNYIDDSEKNAREVIEIEDDDDEQGNNRNVDYRPPSTSRAKKGRRVKSDPAPLRQENVSIQGGGPSGKGRRKSGNMKDKPPQKDDRTLTQMNYVQRVLVEPDEDVKLEYAYITPKKKHPKRQTANTDKADALPLQGTYISEPSSKQKRRKLSPSSEGKGLHETEGNLQKKVQGSPVTPRKSTRTEIPSSQSPDSPGIAFITSSQFRSATRSPKARALKSPNEPFIKEESRGPIDQRDPSRSPQIACADGKPSLGHLISPCLPPSRLDTAKDTTESNEPPSLPSDTATNTPDSRQHPGPLQRTVVYETDAESDDGDSGDELLDFPSSFRNGNASNANYETQSEDDSNPPNTESQELPAPPLPDQGMDSGSYPPESNLLSDASICYQRLHPATQFPLEPVPTINTQKMAELFPNESNGLHTLTPSPSSSPMKARPESKRQMVCQTQYTDEYQAESQDANEIPTEVIPGSSPVARDDDGTSMKRRAPAALDAVVQVESSQAVDRAHRQRTVGQDSAPRGMLTRSQILTSSVMESVPLPFWMSSQDSLGEPYSLPDT
ncbi:uncharacterized protein APUU_20982S [Aspergillus puulaauensis]|uniref:Uncharacterized protein n=1 Tax=Aspergillus puulaauensis TaxID=1220207 RepID=A0A7R7XFW0_9EURO|nr:uncharacterized protein APUU_20982S [Aspergillus puulaauensis]BCS20550.1 hypothetical protein APUU_20982S [Aspergillus puulaauensis]